jgi:hypothetical protein
MTVSEEPKGPSSESDTPAAGTPPGDPSVVAPFFTVCGLIDLIAPSVVAGSRLAVIGGLTAGLIFGQFGLIAVWAGFGSRQAFSRVLCALLAVGSLYSVFLLGLVMADGFGREVWLISRMLLAMPLVLLFAALPPLIVRTITGRRLVRGRTKIDGKLSTGRQFGLSQVMGFTALFAAALGCAGLGVSLISRQDSQSPEVLWFGTVLWCVGAMIASAVGALPCVWAAFLARDKTRANVVVSGYLFSIGVLLGVIMSATGSGPGYDIFAAFFCMVGGAALLLLGGLNTARSAGYALVRPQPGDEGPIRHGSVGPIHVGQ